MFSVFALSLSGFTEIWHYNFVQTYCTLTILRLHAADPTSSPQLDVAASWELVAANVEQMKVWCTACSANFQAQLALYEAEIAYTKLDERVQADDATLTDDEHESIMRTINVQYREAFRHVTHALPRRLKSTRNAAAAATVQGRQPSEHSINVSPTHRTAPHHILAAAVLFVQLF